MKIKNKIFQKLCIQVIFVPPFLFLRVWDDILIFPRFSMNLKVKLHFFFKSWKFSAQCDCRIFCNVVAIYLPCMLDYFNDNLLKLSKKYNYLMSALNFCAGSWNEGTFIKTAKKS